MLGRVLFEQTVITSVNQDVILIIGYSFEIILPNKFHCSNYLKIWADVRFPVSIQAGKGVTDAYFIRHACGGLLCAKSFILVLSQICLKQLCTYIFVEK